MTGAVKKSLQISQRREASRAASAGMDVELKSVGSDILGRAAAAVGRKDRAMVGVRPRRRREAMWLVVLELRFKVRDGSEAWN